MQDLYLPTLHTFAMDNTFTGSCGNFRFLIKPNVVKFPNSKEVDMDNSSIEAKFWHGALCYEKSEIEAVKTFPMSQDGRLALKHWLEENI